MAEATKGLGLVFLFIQRPPLNERDQISTDRDFCQKFELAEEIQWGKYNGGRI
jgi:hypothetical protein